jgi:hypothetical protein
VFHVTPSTLAESARESFRSVVMYVRNQQIDKALLYNIVLIFNFVQLFYINDCMLDQTITTAWSGAIGYQSEFNIVIIICLSN